MAKPRLIKPQGNPQGEMKDLIEQINRCLTERDATIAELTGVGFRTIAAGRVQMNGAGGFTIRETRGCSVAVTGTDLRITFDEDQPTPLRYHVTGTRIGGGSRAQFLTSYLVGSCIVRITDMANVVESFAAVALSYTFRVTTF